MNGNWPATIPTQGSVTLPMPYDAGLSVECSGSLPRTASCRNNESVHFLAQTTNPNGKRVRVDSSRATSGFSRFKSTRLLPPALMISQMT